MTKKDWAEFASEVYNNKSSFGKKEFDADLRRFTFIEKWLNEWTVEKNPNQILNNIVILCNLFGKHITFLTRKRYDDDEVYGMFCVVLEMLGYFIIENSMYKYNCNNKDWIELINKIG